MSSRQAQIETIWVGFFISSYRVKRSSSSWKNSLANSGRARPVSVYDQIDNCQLSWLLNMAVESSPIFWTSPTLADMFGLQTGFFCLFVCFGGSALSSKMITITLSYVFSKMIRCKSGEFVCLNQTALLWKQKEQKTKTRRLFYFWPHKLEDNYSWIQSNLKM